ncbi:MAG: beta-propeller fold lactonase family protein [Candidatus Tumulicola sp.]
MNPRIMAAIVAFAAAVCGGCSGAAQTSLTPAQVFASQSHATRGLARRAVPGPELYVANSGNDTVTVYAAASNTLLRTISKGIHTPYAIAFDPSGNLYVANYSANDVTVYAPGSDRVLRTISEGVNLPAYVAFDAIAR